MITGAKSAEVDDMKRLLAVLMGCAVAAGTLAGCGKSKSSSLKKGDASKLVGEWHGDKLDFGVENDTTGWIGVEQDVSDVLCLKDDGSLMMSPSTFSKDDYKFDGEKLVLEVNRKTVLNMTKVEPGSADEVAGRYKLKSGQVYDSVYNGYNKKAETNNDIKLEKGALDVYIDLGTDKSVMQIRFPLNLEIYDSSMFIESKTVLSENMLFGMVEYDLSGDKLSISNSSGDKYKFTKVD